MLDSLTSLAASETQRSFEQEAEISKKGFCWFELNRLRMAGWGVGRQVKFLDSEGDGSTQHSSAVIKDENDGDDNKDTKADLTLNLEERKRKCLPVNQPGKGKAARCKKKTVNSGPNKHSGSVERWSAERYKQAEESMLQIMKKEGAAIENPISRPALRMAARKFIGDTGLLDHLLKHIDGKVAPDGIDRFRRCYNTSGVMEYWLESADEANIRKEAGILPFSWKPNADPLQDSACAAELKLLKEEMATMKRNMQELVSKQQEQSQANLIEEIQKDLVKYMAKKDEFLLEFPSSLNSMQGMYEELGTWRTRVEQQLLEISNSLTTLQASKQCTLFNASASDRWEDWLEGSNVDNFQGGNLAPWLDISGLIPFGQDVAVKDMDMASLAWPKPCRNPSQGTVRAQELNMLNEEMAKTKRVVQELAPRRQEEDNITPDSFVSTNSKLDLDNSFLLFKEILKDLVKWKAKIEQQLMEITTTVQAIQTSRQ